MNLFVGNVDFKATEDQLSDLFTQYGEVNSVKIIKDRATGRSKGFAFVEMEQDGEAQAAIENLNGYEFNSRAISVSEARPRDNDSRGGGGGGYRGGRRD